MNTKMYDLRVTKARLLYRIIDKKRHLKKAVKKVAKKCISDPTPKIDLQSNPDWEGWVSATGTKSYILKDPILDWLKFHNQKFVYKNIKYSEPVIQALRNEKVSESTTFTPFIMNKGKIFEEELDKLLKSKFKDHIDIGGNHFNARSFDKFQSTIDSIMKGVP